MPGLILVLFTFLQEVPVIQDYFRYCPDASHELGAS